MLKHALINSFGIIFAVFFVFFLIFLIWGIVFVIPIEILLVVFALLFIANIIYYKVMKESRK